MVGMILILCSLLFALTLSYRRSTAGLPRVIDGYTVHIRRTFSQDEGAVAHIDVDLNDADVSAEPEFLVQRKALPLPHSYDLFRWTIQQRLDGATDENVTNAASRMVAYARRLSAASRELREELFASVVSGDPEKRLKSLLELTRQYPRSTEAKRAASASLVDDSAAVRLHAAIFLDEEGLEIVEAIVADEEAATELRLLGLRHCLRAVDRSRYGALLDRLLVSSSIEVREGAVYAYADFAGEEGIDRLWQMLDTSPPKIAETIARALGRTSSPRAEGPLLTLLEHRTPDVVIAAAQALTRVGSTTALTALIRVFSRMSSDEPAAPVLRAAIDVLRDDRRPNAGGHLSVVGAAVEAHGGLSLQESSSALSFPEED